MRAGANENFLKVMDSFDEINVKHYEELLLNSEHCYQIRKHIL